jgi:ATP adenylyltransferase
MVADERGLERSRSEPLPPNPGGERLWTPWRMRYVAGGTREEGCIFCNRLAADDDVANLILHRGERAFAIMNLFPYNTGHVMIVPNGHVASPEDADAETTVEMTALRGPLLRALRRVLSPDGFNLGLNIGAVAGAGVADHFHEHVVPRWQGDANFMPILAATTVMPELIPVTYAKLRAEVAREFEGAAGVRALIISATGAEVLLDAEGALPEIAAVAGEPLWRTILREADRLGAREAEIVGWVRRREGSRSSEAMVVRADLSTTSEEGEWSRVVPIGQIAAGDAHDIAHEAARRFIL